MTTAAKKYPDFFKVFLPERSSKRMLIPNAFVEHLKGRVPKKVVLINRSGKVWPVNLHRIGGEIYFDDGWKQFIKDNSVEVADFMVFTYDGSNAFKFKIFEKFGCEKIELKEEEEQEENDDVMEEEESEEEGEKIEKKMEEKHKEKDSVMGEEEEEEEEQEQDNDDEDDEYTEMEEEMEGEYVNGENMKTQCLHQARKALIINKRGTAGSSGTKAEDPNFEDHGIDAENYVQPDNPYFVAKILRKRNNELHIPGGIIHDFFHSLPEKITLCLCCRYVQRNDIRNYHLSLPEQTPIHNPRRMWEGEVHAWKDGRVCIRGWTSFRRRNRISETDVCICEFLLREDQKIEMLLVHVARKG